MSDYGRRWERIREVREQIRALVPTVRTDRLESTEEDVWKHCSRLRRLLEEWRTLEREA